jgi:NTE family protein
LSRWVSTPLLGFLALLLIVPGGVPPVAQESPAEGAAGGDAGAIAPPPAAAGHTAETLGIALAGGGALGFAHIGVLLVLEEYGISPAVVTGTSMGAVAGALYAAGYSAREILAITASIDWNQIFIDQATRRELSFEGRRDSRLVRGRVGFSEGQIILQGGASSAQLIIEVIDDLTRSVAAESDFTKYPRSLGIVAADLGSGEEVIFTSGDLKSAVRASMAVPGAFTPLFYDGRLLIDGGWVNNLPVDVARDLGAERVIAVNLSLLERDAEDLRDVPAILNQASRILRQERIEENIAMADLVISPDVEEFTPADFGRWRELVERGREAAEAAVPELLALRERTAQHVVDPFLRPEDDRQVTIAEVRIVLPDFLDVPESDEIREEFVERFGRREVNVSAVQAAVYGLYDTNRYRLVSYDLEETEDGRHDLELYLVPQPPASSELRVGFGVRTQIFENVFVRSILHADYRKPLRPRVVGERPSEIQDGPRLEVEGWLSDVGSARVGISAPIHPSARIRQRVYALSTPLLFYDDGTVESLYAHRSAGGDVGVRFQPGRQWRFDTALFGEWVWNERLSGSVQSVRDGAPRAGLAGLAQQDNLDRGVYPTRGTETRVHGRVWLTEVDLEPLVRAQADHRSYVPVGRNVVTSAHFAAGTDFDSGVDEEDLFAEGGVESLSGFYFGELRGRHVVSGEIGIRVGVFDLPLPLGRRGYLFGTAGVSRVWEGSLADALDPNHFEASRLGGSIGLGLDTVIGELSLGVGINDDLRVMSYILLGPAPTPHGEIWSW